MTPHSVTDAAVNFPELRSMTRFGSWTFDLRVIARIAAQALRELWRRDIDESTWTTAVRWWGWGETPETTTPEPDLLSTIRLLDDLARSRASWN